MTSSRNSTQTIRVPDLTRLLNLVTADQEKRIKFGDGYKFAEDQNYRT